MGALGVTHRITNSSNEIVQLFFSLQQMRSLVLLVVLICHGADGFKLTKVASPRLPSATTAPKFPACALPIAMGQQAKVRVRRTPLVHMTEDEAIVISKETALRSFVKAAGWRFTAGVVTATTSFIFTGASECLARSRPFFVAFCPCPSRQLTPPPPPHFTAQRLIAFCVHPPLSMTYPNTQSFAPRPDFRVDLSSLFLQAA